jgi:hypothetical protein
MRIRLNVVLTSAIVLGIGLITLLGLTVSNDFGGLTVIVTATPIRLLTEIFLRLASLVLALSVLVGVLNLFVVNVSRVVRGRTIGARLGSLLIIASFLLVVFLRVMDSVNATQNLAVFTETVQVPLEASLAGLLFFALVWGGMRVLRRGLTFGRVMFVAAMMIVLLGTLPVRGVGLLYELNNWLLNVPVSAGARGILLGVGLATLVAGVRILIGQDRQYGE